MISGLVQSKPENWLNKWGFVADEAVLKLAPWMGPLYRMVLILVSALWRRAAPPKASRP